MAEDDGDDCFGDFKFASSSPNPTNPTVFSHQINGQGVSSSAIDDDEWSDFISPSHTSMPDSAGNSMLVTQKHWVKVRGALPLSLFGEEEEESGDGDEHSSFSGGVTFSSNNNGDYVKNGSILKEPVGINDLIWTLYNQDHLIKDVKEDRTDVVLKLPNSYSNGLNSNFNGPNSGKDDMKADLNISNWDLVSGINNLDDDDGWEFKGAESENRVGDGYVESNQIKADNGWNSNFIGSTLSKTGLNSDSGDLHPSFVGSNSVANGLDWIISNGNGNGNVKDDDDDDDDGWEFKVAESESRIRDENSKVDWKGWGNTEGAYVSNFDIGEHRPSHLFVPPNGLPKKFDAWDLTFKFNPSSVTKDATILDFESKCKQNDTANDPSSSPVVLNVGSDENLWEFKDAISESKLNYKVEEQNVADVPPAVTEALPIDGDNARGPYKSTAVSNGKSHNSDQLDFGFSFKSSSMSEDSFFSDAYSKGKEKPEFTNTSPAPVEAFTFGDTMEVKNAVRLETHKEALPLSIFGDDKLGTDDPLPDQDVSIYMPTSYSRNTRPGSSISISDLISSLYVQAEQNPSVNYTQEAGENAAASNKMEMESYSVSDGDDFDDDSWEFKGALSGRTSVGDQTSGNHIQKPNDNVLDSIQTVLDSNLVNSNGFDDNTFKFKEADSGSRAEDWASVPCVQDLLKICPSNPKLNIYVNFYCNLIDELCIITQDHLDNLKKTQSIAALSGDDVKLTALNKKIEELTSKEFQSENCSPQRIGLDELLEVLKEPLFQVLESEYRLSRRLLLAEKDSSSAIELLNHASVTLKILRLGSMEDQSCYVSTLYEMISVCNQELKHGASIWKQSLQKNVHSQMLSESQGKRYILGLGEIYRVFEVLGASAKLYQPWILCSTDPKGMFDLLTECYNTWLTSGLVEALQSICDPIGIEYDGTLKALLESISYIHDLDAVSLQNHVLYQQEPTCCLSGLTPAAVPGMKMVVWNGEHYFLTLANLWANLVQHDPPKLCFRHLG